MKTDRALVGKGVLALPIALLFAASSCQSDYLEIPVKEIYAQEFIKKFGLVDPNETWNTAKRVHAQIDPSLLAGADKVEVLTYAPGNRDARILARYEASKAKDFAFDAPRGLESVYARILDADGRVIKGTYVKIPDGTMTMGGSLSRAEYEAPAVSLYDLTNSPAFGGAKVTDRNITMWENFTKDGKPVYTGKQTGLDHTSYETIPVEISNDKSFWTQKGKDDSYSQSLGNYAGAVKILPFSDLSKNASEISIRITVELDDFANIEDHNWRNLQLNSVDWQTSFDSKSITEAGYYEIPLSSSYSESIIKEGAIIQGCCLKVTKVEFKETKAKDNNTVKFADIFNIYGFTTSPQYSVSGYINNCLGPDNSRDKNGYPVNDIVPIVGSTGVFHEEVDRTDINHQCNLEKYYGEIGAENGVEYVVKEDSEVGLNFFFGCASYFNSLGYFYYDGGASTEQILRQPKFILVSNAYPGNNIQFSIDGNFQHETPYNQLIKGSGENDDIAQPNYEDGLYDGELGDEGKNKRDGWSRPQLTKRMVDYFENNKTATDYTDENSGTTYGNRIKSAYYPLYYYKLKPDGTPDESTRTTKFPQGTHIAFFMILGGHYWIDMDGKSDQKVDHVRLAFSLPQLNDAIGNTFNESHSHEWLTEKDYSVVKNPTGTKSWAPFVSYKWGGKIIMGVEDMPCQPYTDEQGRVIFTGGDHDMNDLLFNISGEVTRDEDKEMNKNTTQAMKWIVACEDLGATDDFDFNDVVFGVEYAAGEDKAEVTALAAGGTLPVYIRSKYPQIDKDGNQVTNENDYLRPEGSSDGEFHSWFGNGDISPTTMLNTNRGQNPGVGKTVTIKVDPNQFSLTTNVDKDNKPTAGRPADDNMGGFSVVVVQPEDKTTTTITPPHTGGENDYIPQMFLVPSEWQWPNERVGMENVYPGFVEFGDSWWTNKQNNDLLFKRSYWTD